MTNGLPWLAGVCAAGAVAIVATALFARGVLAAGAGTAQMQSIALAIREGAHAFQRRQYRTVALMALPVAAGLFAVYSMGRSTQAWKTALAFLAGAVCSAAAGWWAMFVALRANVRVANAARTRVSEALTLALRGGAAAALPIAASSLLGVGALFFLFGGLDAPREVPYQLAGFAFGASFVALFAQLGGGIYTKAADIGADLVGKLESQIPEDDPRNAAVIADLVGDNVGDCAGRGADIFESAAAENIGTMILGVVLFAHFGIEGILFPLVAGALGLLASIAGVLVVRLRHESEDPMSALTRGQLAAQLLGLGGIYLAVRWLLGNNGWLFLAGALGVVASAAFAAVMRYYTGIRHRPVQWIARSSSSGPTANVIAGLAVGLESTALPVVGIFVALLGAYGCGIQALPGVEGAGLYGTAVATIGMLTIVGYVLSADMFGPITDNAGGIIEMSAQTEEARARTDRLDAAGNTTKALTKGYAIGSAALAGFLLFSAYLHEIGALVQAQLQAAGDPAWASFRFERVDLGKLPVFTAALFGGAVIFVFSGQAIRAVVRDAMLVIGEVRRQFREIPGIMDGTARPDYGRCVDLLTRGALRGMVVPGLLAVAAPVALGIGFRLLGGRADPLLGAEAVAATMMSGAIVGILMASLMNTSGGAWDNAKKWIETGELGGKSSEAHRAAVVGDAVGDPLKDTAGPSLHVLIKLLGTVSLVAAPLFV